MIIGVCVHLHLRMLSLALSLAALHLLLLPSLFNAAAVTTSMATAASSAMSVTMAHALVHFVMLWRLLHHHQCGRLLLLTLLLALCLVFLALSTSASMARFLHSTRGILFAIFQLNEFHRTRCTVVVFIENSVFHTVHLLCLNCIKRCDNGHVFIVRLLICFILLVIGSFLFACVRAIILLLLILASVATICGIRFGIVFGISFLLCIAVAVAVTLWFGICLCIIVVVRIVFTIIGGLFWCLQMLVFTAKETGGARDREREEERVKKPVNKL